MQYLLALTVLAAQALRTTQKHALPISLMQSAFTAALPPIAGLALVTAIALTAKFRKPIVTQLTLVALLVYAVTLIAVSASQIAASGTRDLPHAVHERVVRVGGLLVAVAVGVVVWEVSGFVTSSPLPAFSCLLFPSSPDPSCLMLDLGPG